MSRTFVHRNRAWYAPSMTYKESVDDVCFGVWGDDGLNGEMIVEWIPLENGKPASPRLEVFDDAWKVLASFTDVVEAMAKVDSQNIQPDAFCELLTSLGFVDETPTERR